MMSIRQKLLSRIKNSKLDTYRYDTVNDWEKIWKKEYKRSSNTDMDSWDGIAKCISESRRANDYEYGRKVLKTLIKNGILDDASNILDIGAGPGTLLIPFANINRDVHAIEPSKTMVSNLKENAEKAGIERFKIFNKKWQDVELSKIKIRYDLVVASYVLGWRVFRDIWEQLKKMEKASKEYCCIIDEIEIWNHEEIMLLQKIVDSSKSIRVAPSIIEVIYGVLCNRERAPKIEKIRYFNKTTLEKELDRKKRFYSRYTEMTPSIEEIIEDHLRKRYLIDGIEDKQEENMKIKKERESAIMWWEIS